MSFEDIPGQTSAKALAEAWLHNDRVPHSILIRGPAGTSKRTLAIELSKAINCTEVGVAPCHDCGSCRKIENLIHPDVHVLLPLTSGARKRNEGDVRELMRTEALAYLGEQTNLAVSNVNIARELLLMLQREIYFAPTEGKRKIGIVFEADRMHPAGANALLKTLEEPPKRALLILVSTFPERLLPTIRSRCQSLKTRALSRDELQEHLQPLQLAPDRFELTVRLAEGNLHRAQEISTGGIDAVRERAERFLKSACEQEDDEYWKLTSEIGGKEEREELERFLEICAQYLRDLFLMMHGCEHQARHIDRKDFLQRMQSLLPPTMLGPVAEEVDRAFQNILQNVTPALALVDLWRRLGQREFGMASQGTSR